MTTYSISLDDVDLALLPVHSRSNDFLKKEHYEFQIMARDGSTEDLHHKCHMCDVDVPAAYTREHWASAKHRANARIATVASKRMRDLISSPPFKPNTVTSGRFCEACSAVVYKDHEKTKEHRIAVIHDRMLVDLMKVYVGDGFDDEDDDITTLEGRNGFTRSMFDVTVETDAKDTDIKTEPNVNITNGDKKNNNNVSPINEPVVITEETETVQNIQEVTSTERNYVKIETETYIKLLGDFGNSEIAFRAIGDKVQIVLDNECVEVSDDHFHSYFRLKGKIQCRVCCETMNLDTEDAHKLTKIHMERVSSPVTDSHCVRKIYDDWSHCIICNQVMKTSAVPAHNQTKNHYDRKKEATIKNNQNNQTKELHQNRPSTSRWTNSFPKPYQKTTVNTVTDKIEYPYEKRNPQSVFCVVCQCEVPIRTTNRIDHLKGMRHTYSLKNANKLNQTA